MAKVAVVGIATLDIVNFVDHYPHEDEELRASAQQIRRGGNAANMAVVLAQFGHTTHWIGNLADDQNAQLIRADFGKQHVDISQARTISATATPTSYITLNSRNASRTIVHYRDLPELAADAVDIQALANFDWVHFEGRNIPQTKAIIEALKTRAEATVVSIEFEKVRGDETALFALADVLIFSKHYFAEKDLHQPDKALTTIPQQPGQNIVCTWGDQGAFAIDTQGTQYHQAACVLKAQVDSIGAGDCFNAALIDARLQGKNWDESLAFANKIAAAKIAQHGFEKLISD